MPTPDHPRKPTTISVVSHGQFGMVLPLLEQLDALSHTALEKVVLTLNIPEDNLLKGRQWKFPLEVVENRNPKGFGANHNSAFERCTTPWFLVLNPDIRFDYDVLAP